MLVATKLLPEEPRYMLLSQDEISAERHARSDAKLCRTGSGMTGYFYRPADVSAEDSGGAAVFGGPDPRMLWSELSRGNSVIRSGASYDTHADRRASGGARL